MWKFSAEPSRYSSNNVKYTNLHFFLFSWKREYSKCPFHFYNRNVHLNNLIVAALEFNMIFSCPIISKLIFHYCLLMTDVNSDAWFLGWRHPRTILGQIIRWKFSRRLFVHWWFKRSKKISFSWLVLIYFCVILLLVYSVIYTFPVRITCSISATETSDNVWNLFQVYKRTPSVTSVWCLYR